MDYVTLGKSDLKVPVVGFGAWQAGKSGWGEDYTDEDSIKAIRYSLDHGVNFIDTAEVYGYGHSEEVVAKAMEGYARDDVVIATKVAGYHFRYKDVIKAAENSLKRLNTDYIDLYQLHWPDNYTPVGETMSAMEQLVKEGKIRNIGLCNFPRPLVEEIYAKKSPDLPIVSNQMRYNMIQREVEGELYPYMKQKGISMIAWSPIAKGLLTGKYNEGNIPGDEIRKGDALFTKDNLKRLTGLLNEISEISEKHGKTMAQVSLNYLISKEAIVIPGAKNVKQAEENMGAAGWKLSKSEVDSLDRASDVELTYS
ncbi:hypothetical protein IX51_04665 [uncultured archaeon]|nr:hypothetical protein IX51_04665 [uncultured archaeon]